MSEVFAAARLSKKEPSGTDKGDTGLHDAQSAFCLDPAGGDHPSDALAARRVKSDAAQAQSSGHRQ